MARYSYPTTLRNILSLDAQLQLNAVGKTVRIAVWRKDEGEEDSLVHESVGKLEYLIIGWDEVRYAFKGFTKDSTYTRVDDMRIVEDRYYGTIQWMD